MSTVPAHQTAADLLSAANHIETYGLRKGQYGSTEGRCCTVGAIRVAVFGRTDIVGLATPDTSDRYHAATDAMEAALPEGAYLIPWTDADERTEEQVVAKLREAAEAVFPSV